MATRYFIRALESDVEGLKDMGWTDDGGRVVCPSVDEDIALLEFEGIECPAFKNKPRGE